MSRDTCCILVPSRNGIDQECERALNELARRGYQLRIMRGWTSIDQIRSQMATDALAEGFKELMWIDDDVVFLPDDVDRLLAHDLPIVGGVYLKKGKRQVAVRWKDDGPKSIVLGAGGGLVEVKYAATGFLLTRAEVYEKMAGFDEMAMRETIGQFGRPMVPFFQPMVLHTMGEVRPMYLSEDWAFCQRADYAGFKIMVDTRPRLYHVGRYAYSWEDLAPRERVESLTVHLE